MPESFFSRLRDDPATKGLIDSIGGFATAKAGSLASSAVTKMTAGEQTEEEKEKGEEAEPDTASKGAVRGAMEAKEEGKSGLFGGIKGALKGLFKRGGSAKRPTNIYEQIFIGVPVEQAYANWTEYSNFPEFMKGPESVKVNKEEGEDGEVKETHQWTAKIFLNRRSWKATVEEDVENRRIRWTTEANKGSIDGAISFTPIGDNATLMVYTLEYRPKGFFEWWGNRWRTVGRRARLDVKHFGRYVMMQDQTQDEDEEEPEDGEEGGITEDEEPGEGPVVEPEGPEKEDEDEVEDDTEVEAEPTEETADEPDGEAEPAAEPDAEEEDEEPIKEPKEPVKAKRPAAPRHAPREPRSARD